MLYLGTVWRWCVEPLFCVEVVCCTWVLYGGGVLHVGTVWRWCVESEVRSMYIHTYVLILSPGNELLLCLWLVSPGSSRDGLDSPQTDLQSTYLPKVHTYASVTAHIMRPNMLVCMYIYTYIRTCTCVHTYVLLVCSYIRTCSYIHMFLSVLVFISLHFVKLSLIVKFHNFHQFPPNSARPL